MITSSGFTERLQAGRAHRKQMARAGQASCLTKQRRVDPLRLLAESMKGRVPALVPIKYERMAASPFGFFRGAVPIMAYDLSLTPNTGLHTQICGDAHVRNLGAYAAPDGRLVFDINDFDETIRGPFEWDVKRTATSILVAGRDSGIKDSACEDAARAFLARYRITMHAFTRISLLEVARFQVHRLRSLTSIRTILQLAERATPQHSLEVLTEPMPASASRTPQVHRVFRNQPPVLHRVTGEEARQVLDSLPTYAESLLPERQHLLSMYKPLDVAFKVVGTGSVGLRDYCVYMQGNGPGDPLFLQIKEEPGSAYIPYLGQPASPHHHGRRVAEGQRAMQLQSDPFLGWTTIAGRDYVVRQLNDHKASIDLASLRPRGFVDYANLCGELLARGHARAGDAATLAGYIGLSDRFDEAVLSFARAYANQTERDWRALVKSLRKRPLRKKASAVLTRR